MNAQEARQKAIEVNTNNTNSQYAEIKKLIEQAANVGGYEIRYYKSINADCEKKLNSEGYKLNSQNDPRDQGAIDTHITW